MDIAAIRADLGTALGVIDGLNVVTTKAGSIVAPAAILGAYNVDPHTVFGGAPQATLTWTVIIAVTDAAAGSFEDLDAYLSDEGDKSLTVALEEFGSAYWSSLTVQQTSDVQVIDVGGISYIGCRIPVEIFC